MENHDFEEEEQEMKKGDKVYIKGMQGGPYEVQDFEETIIKQNGLYLYIPIVNVDGEGLYFDNKLLEPAEPEIEEGRLVYTDGGKVRKYVQSAWGLAVDIEGIMNNPFHMVQDGEEGQQNAAREVEPVHRRLQELDEKQRVDFVRLIQEWGGSPYDIFYKAYKLITGEEHP